MQIHVRSYYVAFDAPSELCPVCTLQSAIAARISAWEDPVGCVANGSEAAYWYHGMQLVSVSLYDSENLRLTIPPPPPPPPPPRSPSPSWCCCTVVVPSSSCNAALHMVFKWRALCTRREWPSRRASQDLHSESRCNCHSSCPDAKLTESESG